MEGTPCDTYEDNNWYAKSVASVRLLFYSRIRSPNATVTDKNTIILKSIGYSRAPPCQRNSDDGTFAERFALLWRFIGYVRYCSAFAFGAVYRVNVRDSFSKSKFVLFFQSRNKCARTRTVMGSFDVHKVNFFSPQLLSVQCMAVESETQKLAVGRYACCCANAVLSETNSSVFISRSNSSIEIWDVSHKPHVDRTLICDSSVEGLGWFKGRLFSCSANGTVTEHDLHNLSPLVCNV